MFGKKLQPSSHSPQSQLKDDLLGDLLRGVEGRIHKENHLPRGYFSKPESLEATGFSDHAGDNFLGIIGGRTEEIRRADGRTEYKTTGGVPVGSKDDRHRTLVAGSRSGKGRSVIIPELLTYAGSMIIIDPKGENAAVTARYREEKLGQDVFIIDPFKATPASCEPYRKQFNPLSLITEGNLTAIEDAGLIADALVVSTNSKDAHWDETAKAFIEGVILFVASGHYSKNEKNLLLVAQLIAGKHHASIDELLQDMIELGGPDDRVAAAAISLREKADQERGSVLSNARRAVKFLDYDAMENALSGHDFNLEDLKNKAMTVYLVLPTMRMATCRQLLRIFVNLTLAAIEKNPKKPNYPIQMILDEMATLGYMRELENAIGQVAGLGMRITCVLQDLGQLKSLYKDRFETFLGNSGILQFFGTVDHFTSKWISDYLGKTTIRVYDKGAMGLGQKTDGQSGDGYKQQSTELMTSEEVRRTFARDDYFNRQLVLIPGKRPIILQRANYDHHEFFEGRFEDIF